MTLKVTLLFENWHVSNSLVGVCTNLLDITVPAERCCTDDLLMEVGTLSPLLRELHWENPIAALCSGVSLPSPHSAVIPRRQCTSCRWCRRLPSCPLDQFSVTLHLAIKGCVIIIIIITGPPTHSVGGRLVTVVGVCRRRLLHSICNVTHQGAARGGTVM